VRVAALSDIHANLHALQAVWEDLERQKPDAVYCLGDLVGYGAYPNEVIDFIRQRQVPTVMGNYDEGVGFDLHECGCAYTRPDERLRGDLSLRWTQAHTAPDGKQFLQGLLIQLRLEQRPPKLLLVHGSPRKINEYLYEDRPPATFERITLLAAADVLVFGHTHLPYQKWVRSTLLVNAGSVGKPKDGDPRAGYALIELGRRPRAQVRRVAYDVEAAARAVQASGLPVEFAEELRSGGAAKGAA
jgi:putative phosphoesterase